MPPSLFRCITPYEKTGGQGVAVFRGSAVLGAFHLGRCINGERRHATGRLTVVCLATRVDTRWQLRQITLARHNQHSHSETYPPPIWVAFSAQGRFSGSVRKAERNIAKKMKKIKENRQKKWYFYLTFVVKFRFEQFRRDKTVRTGWTSPSMPYKTRARNSRRLLRHLWFSRAFFCHQLK